LRARIDVVSEPDPDAVADAFARLHAADQDRDRAIADLVALGFVRSKVFVGDLGELIAARYYGVDLAPLFTEGYDLVSPDGRRVQVKALRGDNGKRTIVARTPLPETCDTLFAIRLYDDYTPREAIEADRVVCLEHFGARGVHWTKRFAADPRVTLIPGERLRLR
jgi:hypothetical protein